jgi:hypothetical protein
LSVSGNDACRVLEVAFGKTVTLSGFTIKQGRAEFGGGIYSVGKLTLNNCVLSGNTAAGAKGTFEHPNGHEGWGGGIYNFGTLALTNTIVTGNVAVGGAGAYGESVGVGATGFGGGILNGGGGTVTLTNSTFSNNKARRQRLGQRLRRQQWLGRPGRRDLQRRRGRLRHRRHVRRQQRDRRRRDERRRRRRHRR